MKAYTRFKIDEHFVSATLGSTSFSVSNDNESFKVIHYEVDSLDLNNSGIGFYRLNNEGNYYKYFKIQQTKKTYLPDYKMRIDKLDLFGYLHFCKVSCNKEFAQLFSLSYISFSLMLIKL